MLELKTAKSMILGGLALSTFHFDAKSERRRRRKGCFEVTPWKLGALLVTALKFLMIREVNETYPIKGAIDHGPTFNGSLLFFIVDYSLVWQQWKKSPS